MFSKEESARMRQEFWTSFGKSFPRKWILYNTKIKGFSFKFHFDTKKAMVLVVIEGNLEHRIRYFEKMQSLENLLMDYWEDAVFSDSFELENGKEISCVFVEKYGVSIHNKSTWQETMNFLHEKMLKLEEFWLEYEDFFRDE
ncbi:DUF4268 domain-containing protein [Bergeyella cardium]|uniref:DUF4268 domain-containing protein n=1 Tax=Bergeyella cardium TaxID=1585976 RepID=A0A6P1QUH1_9FLAO|nr:DUF4268 domain-containing protein [Bergeyella cardium]QHN64460.1 DUF4268 domain-containing protein [Bergeyella cardium]WHE33751.1 DUF4268 domain-containing protein [Bergeyella cardium]WHF60401.1 DUF4268 domain-containing protein [Bergeyella cardium]